MTSFVFGHTELGLPIPAYRFGHASKKVLILGGVHGDETEGVVAAFGLLNSFSKSYSYRLTTTLIPAFNLDGVLEKRRVNTNLVDLNRNLPTNDWTSEVATERYHPGPKPCSESENQALVTFLEKEKPQFILSLHSWKPLLNVNGECQREAQAIAERTGYAIEESIGYPTPGCLGTFCGLERDMPTLTYELERGMDSKTILKKHVPAILEALKVTEGR